MNKKRLFYFFSLFIFLFSSSASDAQEKTNCDKDEAKVFLTELFLTEIKGTVVFIDLPEHGNNPYVVENIRRDFLENTTGIKIKTPFKYEAVTIEGKTSYKKEYPDDLYTKDKIWQDAVNWERWVYNCYSPSEKFYKIPTKKITDKFDISTYNYYLVQLKKLIYTNKAEIPWGETVSYFERLTGIKALGYNYDTKKFLAENWALDSLYEWEKWMYASIIPKGEHTFGREENSKFYSNVFNIDAELLDKLINFYESDMKTQIVAMKKAYASNSEEELRQWEITFSMLFILTSTIDGLCYIEGCKHHLRWGFDGWSAYKCYDDAYKDIAMLKELLKKKKKAEAASKKK